MDNEMTMDATEDELSEWESLSDRQKDLAEDIAESAMTYGMFKQDSSADGAHYFDGSKNPFKANGIKCDNCIFFNEETNQCIVVEGTIDPEGVCKLWVIPEDELNETPAQEAQEEATGSEEVVTKSVWNSMFDPNIISKGIL